jgi:hypothetical protein
MRFSRVFKPLVPAKIVTLFVALTLFMGVAGASTSERVVQIQDTPVPVSVQNVVNLLNAIDLQISPLVAPLEAQITIGSKYSESAFTRDGSFQLYAGLKPSTEPLAVLAHEYGHAVLEKNLLQDPIKKAKIAANGKLRLITLIVGEFFADTVAVSYYKNPQVISELQSNPAKNALDGTWDDLLTRDFVATSADQANWESMLPLASFFMDMYYPLLPARWAFWEIAKENINNEDYRGQLIPKTYAAVEKVLNTVMTWDETQLGGKKMEPELMKKLNEMLIKEMKASLL